VGKIPTLGTIEVLTPIWRRVLQRPSARVDDNFFDLGGDPALAVQLFREIAKVFARQLPPLTIYQAPTLTALSALVEGTTGPPFPTLVLMKKGTSDTPVFITHGLGGSVMEVFRVVKGLQSRHPIYGLQSKGFDGKAEPLARVEDMAECYLEAIRKLQPRGPYALIGYSFGGLAMMEVAQRLQDTGERVALLAMVETYPHRNLMPLKIRLGLLASLARRHGSIVWQLPVGKKLAYLTRRSERGLYASWGDNNQGVGSHQTESGLLFACALERVRDAESLALACYRPRFYAGKINFVKAGARISLFPRDPEDVWANLTQEFEMDTTPGDHFEMVTTRYRELAAVLSRHIAAAFSGE
jgi:acetoacetyl-CoA synthetase